MKTLCNCRKAYGIAIAFVICCSCKKVTDLKVKQDSSPQIVIEGNISSISGPQYVKISYSIPADDTIAPPSVSKAIVLVTDEENNKYLFNETNTPGVYMNGDIKTKPGENYTLKVQANGQTYTAASRMPGINVKIDTMSIIRADVGSVSYRAVNIYFNDPPNPGNQYRFVMTINDVVSKTISVMNNSLVQGNYACNVFFPYDVALKIGDVIVVELQCIDKAAYDYWYTLSQQQSSIYATLDNSSKSVNPPSNFDNNALGYFSAHTSNSMKYKIYGEKKF